MMKEKRVKTICLLPSAAISERVSMATWYTIRARGWGSGVLIQPPVQQGAATRLQGLFSHCRKPGVEVVRRFCVVKQNVRCRRKVKAKPTKPGKGFLFIYIWTTRDVYLNNAGFVYSRVVVACATLQHVNSVESWRLLVSMNSVIEGEDSVDTVRVRTYKWSRGQSEHMC